MKTKKVCLREKTEREAAGRIPGAILAMLHHVVCRATLFVQSFERFEGKSEVKDWFFCSVLSDQF